MRPPEHTITTPDHPERVPMTESELTDLLNTTAESVDSFNIVMTHWRIVARAVEAYYGISAQAKKEGA